MTEKEQNYFERLNSINVSDKIEKKGGLSYLSWAHAWAEAKKHHPEANYKIYETPEGRIYWDDGRTAWVKTAVIIEGVEHVDYLPIMDYRNNSIPIGKFSSFEVNKTIQRSLTKALARHGLGLYIYAGEDLPESETKEMKKDSNDYNTLNDEHIKNIQEALNKTNKSAMDICSAYRVEGLKDLTISQYELIIARLKKLAEKPVEIAETNNL